MTSPYTPRPALKLGNGYLVFHSVQKRFPAFLRCNALYFLSETEFAHAELAPSPAEFRNAVTKLPPHPILGPLGGGAPLIIYLAGRGLEDDFRELAAEIQEDNLARLADIPDLVESILIVFGDSSIDTTGWVAVPSQEPAPSPAPALPEAEPEPIPQPTAGLPPTTPAPAPGTGVRPNAPTPAPEPRPVKTAPPLPEPEPSPVPAASLAPVPPTPAPGTGVQLNAPTPAPEPSSAETATAKPESPQPTPPGSAIPESDALARELGRHFARQQDAVGAAVQNALQAAQEEWLRKQLDSLKQSQAELAARQATSSQAQQEEQNRQLHAALARLRNELSKQQEDALAESREKLLAELRALLIGMYDDHAQAQQQAIADLRHETSTRLQELQAGQPEWSAAAQRETRKAQEEQNTKLQAALKSIEDTAAWLRSQAAHKPEAPIQETAVNPEMEGTIKELSWKVDGNTTALKTAHSRLGQIMALNLLLIVGLMGTLLCVGGYAFLPSIRAMLPAFPLAAADLVGTATPIPVTPSVSVEPTAPPPTQGAAPSSNVTLSCSDSGRVQAFYDCSVTNTTDRPVSLTLVVMPDSPTTNGFFSSVRVGNQEVTPVIEAGESSRSAKFAIGNYGAGESKPLRVSFSCTAADGCKSTTFTLTVLAGDSVDEPGSGSTVTLTTFYPPP